jgi:hypothetical protein
MYYGSLFHEDQIRLVNLSRSQILVYTALISYGGKDRTFTGSQTKLAVIADVSLGSVKRSLKHFELLGWLTSVKYYQVKKYTLNRAPIDQSLGLGWDHSPDLPTNKRVDHSLEPCLDQSLVPPIDHSLEPHVKKNNKEEQLSFHDMTPKTKESKVFFHFVERWSQLQGWKKDLQQKDFEALVESAINFDFCLEIKVIDSWLLKEYNAKSGRCWSFGWFDRLQQWFQRQNQQGSRRGLRLSKLQRYFFDFAVTEEGFETPPILLVENASDTFENGFQRFQMVKEWSTYKEDLFVALLSKYENKRKEMIYRLNDQDFEYLVSDQKWDHWSTEVQQWITVACEEGRNETKTK